MRRRRYGPYLRRYSSGDGSKTCAGLGGTGRIKGRRNSGADCGSLAQLIGRLNGRLIGRLIGRLMVRLFGAADGGSLAPLIAAFPYHIIPLGMLWYCTILESKGGVSGGECERGRWGGMRGDLQPPPPLGQISSHGVPRIKYCIPNLAVADDRSGNFRVSCRRLSAQLLHIRAHLVQGVQPVKPGHLFVPSPPRSTCG